MNKKIIALLIFVAIVLVAVVTCPSKDAHQEALMDKFNTAMSDKISENVDNEDLAEGISLLGGALVSKLLDTVVGTTLKANNYFIFSTGEITFAGKSKVVSIGLFGHVFTTFDADDIKDIMAK